MGTILWGKALWLGVCLMLVSAGIPILALIYHEEMPPPLGAVVALAVVCPAFFLVGMHIVKTAWQHL